MQNGGFHTDNEGSTVQRPFDGFCTVLPIVKFLWVHRIYRDCFSNILFELLNVLSNFIPTAKKDIFYVCIYFVRIKTL